jgi:hypothetical protein
MALEQEVAALRDEVQKLTAVTTKLLEVRREAIETVRSTAAPEKKTVAETKKAAEKPAPEKVEVSAEAAPVKEAEKPAPEKTAAVVTPTEAPAEDDLSDGALKAHVAYYVNFGTSDDAPLTKEEREARMTKVRGVLDHEKIKAKTVAEVPQNARKAFRKKVNEFIAEIETNGPLTAPAEAAAGEVDDL